MEECRNYKKEMLTSRFELKTSALLVPRSTNWATRADWLRIFQLFHNITQVLSHPLMVFETVTYFSLSALIAFVLLIVFGLGFQYRWIRVTERNASELSRPKALKVGRCPPQISNHRLNTRVPGIYIMVYRCGAVHHHPRQMPLCHAQDRTIIYKLYQALYSTRIVLLLYSIQSFNL